MTEWTYKPVVPSIVEALREICGASYVIFDDQKQLRKYSQ